jgi:DNA (cytosine-5)-methyltransferase 1
MNSVKENKTPILSFFSGGGFLDIGFEQSGFDIVWSNEFDKDFAALQMQGLQSWQNSIGHENNSKILNTKSVLEIQTNEILEEAFKFSKPDVFGIIGGPPCQDFSVNGKRKGFIGERGKLTIIYFDKILELKPTFFLMENVTGLIRGASNKEHFGEILKRVKEDYFIDLKILNSLNFGVPQSRERVFIIGIRKDQIAASKWIDFELGNWFKWPVNKEFDNALKKYFWPSTSDFQDKHLQTPSKIPLNLCVESCLVPTERLNKVPNALEFFPLQTSVEKLNAIKEGETKRPSFKRLHRFRYSPTACYGNNEVHLHPYENRRISVREALRIQGVPDSYILSPNISKSKKFKMIGNGVPVPLAKAVADAISDFLKPTLS